MIRPPPRSTLFPYTTPFRSNDTGETDTVNPIQPTISTSANESVTIGAAIHDTALLGNTANKPGGGPAGGTITFFAYGPGDATCGLAPAFTSAPVTVTGNGSYGPVTFTPTNPATHPLLP